MKEKQPKIQKPIELIPNNPFLNYEKIDEEIETADIYIDDSYTDNYSKFLPLSTDDRKYFKIEINGGDLIAFKSPSLTTVDVSKMQLKESLNNILDDLNANKKDFTDQQNKRRDLKRIKKLKNFIDKIDSTENEEIEEKINKPSWLTSLLENQLINQEDVISPRRNRKIVSRITKRKLPYENVSIRKKMQLEANTSEKRLKELPEIYTEIPADQTGKIKAAENIFDKILKQVPSTPQKTVNVTFDEKTNS